MITNRVAKVRHGHRRRHHRAMAEGDVITRDEPIGEIQIYKDPAEPAHLTPLIKRLSGCLHSQCLVWPLYNPTT